MKVIALYKYQRADGGTTVTPNKPDGDHEAAGVRIIADDGMCVTKDGVDLRKVADDDTAAGWTEVADPEETETAEE